MPSLLFIFDSLAFLEAGDEAVGTGLGAVRFYFIDHALEDRERDVDFVGHQVGLNGQTS